MFPPFPQEKAQQYCYKLIDQLDTHKRIDFESPTPNPALKTDMLFSGKTGQMFGVCVCKDSSGSEVVLKAFSGQYNSIWNVDGWVPPLLDESEFYRQSAESDKKIHELTDLIESGTLPEAELKELKKKRKQLSAESMRQIFDLYRISCFTGETKRFNDIMPDGQMPPTGCGECCAPKLLSFAAKNGLRPISLAEFYYGKENSTGKKHKQFYPPCDEKCGYILPHILGLEILYRDEAIIVINKPSGLLSIPGRGADKTDSATTRLRTLFHDCIEQPSVHRLDMDTSGLLVMAFNAEAHRNLSLQFMNGTVQKRYYAVLDKPICPGDGCQVTELNGGGKPVGGKIELPFRLDVEHRPYQIYDEVNGKIGITHWRMMPLEEAKDAVKCFRLSKKQERELFKKHKVFVEFTPETGRTHQLRLHASHPKGLGSPIIGDNLYGTQKEGERLLLHAHYLCFAHPVTGEILEFFSES